MEEVRITTEFITLGQFLKFSGMVERGSDTKKFIADHKILVNGEIEARRGRKLRPADQIQAAGRIFRIKKDVLD